MCELSICVLHYNRWDLTQKCIASIDMQDIPCSCYEKILVDNGSQESCPQPGGWRIVKGKVNRGNIGGQNLCFEQARGTWVLFVANDVHLHKNCLRFLWNARDPQAVVQPLLWTVAGKVDNGGLQWKWPGYGVSQKKTENLTPDCFTSSCYLMPRRIWERIRFDEMLRTSHEDVDFSLSLRQYGGHIGCQVLASATHIGNATLQYTLTNPRQSFHTARVKVIKKHYHGLNRLLRLLTVSLLDALPHF